VELGGARWPGSGGGAGELGRLEVGDGTDSWGPVDRETWERRPARKARSKREDVFPAKTQPTRGLDGPARDGFGLRGQRDQWAGWARGRVGRMVGRAEIKKKNFLIKNWIVEFTKALEICRRRFRRNFDMRIFPKFF
jgi:hypothetical protein